MRKIRFRRWLSSPYFWSLLATPVPPFNVVVATAFWIVAGLSAASNRREAARCLNAQLTYTIVFALPIAVAASMALEDRVALDGGSLIMVQRVAAGVPLGAISLAAILLLALFNLHIFASRALGQPHRKIPRVRFVGER